MEHPTSNETASKSLKKGLRVLDIWALGVGVTITGEYIGWNLALKGNNLTAVFIATLIVSLLYLIWVLALSELSVAMPLAGGPLDYGRRAVDPSLGFVMGWSMFLECQFATITTALATGGYVAFLVNPKAPSPTVQVVAALITILAFFLLHCRGVKEQSLAMIIMTYGAILGLFLFWIVAAGNFSIANVWTHPILPEQKGWKSVLDSVPYALWWLLIIETVALAAEEAYQPSRSIPRGLVWAQLTLIVLAGITLLLACGAVSDVSILATNADGSDVAYPLAKVVPLTPLGKSPLVVYGFGGIALFGLIAGYHGMLFGTSRQLFTLARDGYLPPILGSLHPQRRTPVVALFSTSLITTVFVIANLWFPSAIAVALLVSTLTALVWYILSMGCLILLRRREPELFRHFRAPLYHLLPIAVVCLSAFAAYVYSGIDLKVIPLTTVLYALGLAYYWFAAHPRVHATTSAVAQVGFSSTAEASHELTPPPSPRWWDPLLERVAESLLILALLSIVWMICVSIRPDWGRLWSLEAEVSIVILILLGALGMVSVVALRHTRHR